MIRPQKIEKKKKEIRVLVPLFLEWGLQLSLISIILFPTPFFTGIAPRPSDALDANFPIS